MFSVASIDGESFRGRFEHLIRMRPGLTARRGAGDVLEEELAPATDGRPPDTERYSAAAAEYARSLPGKSSRVEVTHAYQIMTRDVVTVDVVKSVLETWRVLMSRRVRQVPVMGPTNRVVGLVGDRELLTITDLQDNKVSGRFSAPVREVMTSPVICADPVADVRRVAFVMLESRQSAVPVVDGLGHLVGVISRGDILRATLADPPLRLWA